MVGVLWTALFSLLAAFAGHTMVCRWAGHLDPAERFGLAGLVGFGAAGLLTLLIGLLPGGLSYAFYALPVAFVVLAATAVKNGALRELRFHTQSVYDVLATAVLAIFGLLALIAVLAPSLSTDWDTIAYHLAVPKLWLQDGQVGYIQGIHHSNFPSTMEMLFVWGLQWGGQSGAKAFSLAVYVFGCIALFGVGRRWYGRTNGWWAALAFAGIPVVAWESGTGYIDVAHGLYAALGALYAVEAFRQDTAHAKSLLVLSGTCLGFALGTKYTGLQMLVAVVAVVGFAAIFLKGFKQTVVSKLTVTLIAVAIAAPWYIKTTVYTGNPVYPFFYSVLGGKDWDAWRASIYTQEQKSFGVGSEPIEIGHAVLGLAYQPGRYTNPGQDRGGGFPTGAIGFAALLGGVSAALCGRLRREERLFLAVVGLGFVMWFFLSQQSRYLTMLAVPLAVLGAGQVTRVRWGSVIAACIVLQAGVTVYMIKRFQTDVQLEVVAGKVSEDEYLARYMDPFWQGAQAINRLPEGSKVVLYDEVFGYYLDTPYFWANPGHSMLIPYERLESGGEFADALLDLGFTHVYLNLGYADPRFLSALGYAKEARAYSAEEKRELSVDLNHRWKVLLAEALQQGRLATMDHFGRAVLYRVVR